MNSLLPATADDKVLTGQTVCVPWLRLNDGSLNPPADNQISIGTNSPQVHDACRELRCNSREVDDNFHGVDDTCPEVRDSSREVHDDCHEVRDNSPELPANYPQAAETIK